MARATWGSQEINIIKETFSFAELNLGITEIKLIPTTTGTGISTSLQQAGRDRQRIKFRGVADSLTEYNSLLADAKAGTNRTFTYDTVIQKSKIIGLSPAEYIMTNIYEYNIVLIEVE